LSILKISLGGSKSMPVFVLNITGMRNKSALSIRPSDAPNEGHRIVATPDTIKCKSSDALHQVSNAHFKSISNCLNREQSRILHTALDAAQERPVNVRFGGEGFLRQLLFQPRFPNTLSKLFRNVMAHSWNFYRGTAIVVCRI
jgi:hypothetical protein